MLLAIATQFRWTVHHLDVKPVFLNGKLNDDIYVLQLDGWNQVVNELKVYKLQKASY